MTPVNAAVDVIIVNWNGGEEVVQSARSALDFGAHVVLVDNSSTDGSAERVNESLPEVKVLQMGRNAGFAAACNRGVAAGRSEFVFLLNPDARIVSGTADEIGRAFGYADRVAIVAPRIEDGGGNAVASARRFPTPLSLVLYQLKLHPLAKWLPPLRKYLMADTDYARPIIVDQPMGAAFIMRRKDWERFAGMDEAYFLWFEEVDLSKRVAAAGGLALSWPALAVRHIGGTSFARLTPRQRQRIWNRSAARYAEAHFGRAGAAAVKLTLPIATLLNSTAARLRSILGTDAR